MDLKHKIAPKLKPIKTELPTQTPEIPFKTLAANFSRSQHFVIIVINHF